MMRPKVVLEYERAMAEALRVKVEEKMLDNLLGDDEATKEVYWQQDARCSQNCRH